jgi:hypothetical protein
MRIVHTPDEFAESFLAAQREAAASFGVDTILLEKYITKPRHIEVQVIILILSLILLCISTRSFIASYFSSELNGNNGIQIATINTKMSICHGLDLISYNTFLFCLMS